MQTDNDLGQREAEPNPPLELPSGRSVFSASKLPLKYDPERYPRSPHLLINLASRAVWLTRLLSPAAWVLAFFQFRRADGRYFTAPNATAVYQLSTVVLALVLLLATDRDTSLAVKVIVVVTGALLWLETIQYQVWSVLLRPALQREFRIYSATRTLLTLFLQYVQTILVYATVYHILFSGGFKDILLTRTTAIEFSALTMVTVSFGTIVPLPGTPAALVSASQAMLGLFFLGVIISLTLSRARTVEEVEPQ